MTEMGACWRKRSKVSPSCMAAVPGVSGYPEERQQVIQNSTTLEGVAEPGHQTRSCTPTSGAAHLASDGRAIQEIRDFGRIRG